jgi:hypothetical protein
METRVKIIIAGAIMGFLETFSIWWVPEEPYPNFIIAAGVLNGALVALLIASFITCTTGIGKALGLGALIGLLMATVIFLAKGGWVSMDAPFVVPSGLVMGLLLGLVVRWIVRMPAAERST